MKVLAANVGSPSLCRNGIIYGSASPVRFAWMSPDWSEKPKLVSTLLPSCIAQTEQLPPRWQDITRPALP